MHTDLEKNCRGRQLDTKGSSISEANLLSNVGLEDSSDRDPSAGEMQPSRYRSEEELGSGKTVLSSRNGKMGDYLCQSNLTSGTKRSLYKDLSEMRRMKKKIILSISFWMQTDFFPSKYTLQSPFQILPATGTAAEYEPTCVWGTCNTKILNFCLSFLCLDR